MILKIPPPIFEAEIPLPPSVLSPNRRGVHYRTFSRAKQKHRAQCAAIYREVGIESRIVGPCTWRAVFYWGDRRHRDDDNAMSMLKAARDALQADEKPHLGAGIIETDRQLRSLPAVFKYDKKTPRVVIKLWDFPILIDEDEPME